MLTPNERLGPSHQGRDRLEKLFEEFEQLKEKTNYFDQEELQKLGKKELQSKIELAENYINKIEPKNHREEFLVGKIGILVETTKGKIKKL